MNRTLLNYFGIKFHPFLPTVPVSALYTPPAVHAFCHRVVGSLADGGFAMIHGEPGAGKSVVLRLLSHLLASHRDVVVATIDHPQSTISDFYRELGDSFGLTLSMHNRWGGFKSLRARWGDHIAACKVRPCVLIDEAQQMQDAVLNELRILSSRDFDSNSLLSVVFAGDSRLPERFRDPDLLPLGSRIRRRLVLDYASRDELRACLDHLLDAAGNASLLADELKDTLVDHSAGNYRVLMNTAEELMVVAFERQQPRLDEKLFLEVFTPAKPGKPRRR